MREAARHVYAGSGGPREEMPVDEVVSHLHRVASQMEDEQVLRHLLKALQEPGPWDPDQHRAAWHASSLATRLPGWNARVDSAPDGLEMVIERRVEVDPPEREIIEVNAVDAGRFCLEQVTTHRWEDVARVPIRAGVDSEGHRRGQPDLRPLVAEITAIDAVMSHGQDDPWPAEVSHRREELVVRLWRTVRGVYLDVWEAAYPGQAPEVGYQWDQSDPRRPLVLVVRLPGGGPEIRAHVREDAVSPRELEDTAEGAWDGQPRSYQPRVEWLARTAR